MKKKILYAVFSLIFILSLLIPGLGLLGFGPSSPVGNEVLSAPPRLRKADGGLNEAFLNDCGDYFADHYALRAQFATAWAQLNAGLLHSSVEPQVCLGDEGWLYYSESLDDARGLGMSDAQLEALADRLLLAQQTLAEHGTDFIFTIAPNKSSLYPEHLPGFVPVGHENSNAARLAPMLAERGVHYVDLFAVLSAQPDCLYYRYDSHWTDRGAAFAADALLSAADRHSDFSQGPFLTPYRHPGDLSGMLFPTAKLTEQDLLYSAPFLHRCENEPKGGDAITIQTLNPAGEGRLYCWRDSFGAALYPYLAESFSSATFSRSASYDFTKSEALEADLVVLEIVERNLDRLMDHIIL